MCVQGQHALHTFLQWHSRGRPEDRRSAREVQARRCLSAAVALKLENILPQFKQIERLEARGGLRERDRSGRTCGATADDRNTFVLAQHALRQEHVH